MVPDPKHGRLGDGASIGNFRDPWIDPDGMENNSWQMAEIWIAVDLLCSLSHLAGFAVESNHALFPAHLPDIINNCCMVFLSGRLDLLIKKIKQRSSIFSNLAISIFAVFLIPGSLIWAVSFINIYRQPMTRIAASEWIYENIESAVNLTIEDAKGAFSQPLPYSHYSRLDVGKPLELIFTAEADGLLENITIDHVLSPVISEIFQDLSITITKIPSNEIIYSGIINDTFQRDGNFQGKKFELVLNNPQEIHQGEQFQVILEVLNGDSWLNLSGYLSAVISGNGFTYSQPVFDFVKILDETSSYEITFRPFRDG